MDGVLQVVSKTVHLFDVSAEVAVMVKMLVNVMDEVLEGVHVAVELPRAAAIVGRIVNPGGQTIDLSHFMASRLKIAVAVVHAAKFGVKLPAFVLKPQGQAVDPFVVVIVIGPGRLGRNQAKGGKSGKRNGADDGGHGYVPGSEVGVGRCGFCLGRTQER